MANIGRKKLIELLKQGYRVQEADWGGLRYSLYRPEGKRAELYPYYPIRVDTARKLIGEGILVPLPRIPGGKYMGTLYSLEEFNSWTRSNCPICGEGFPHKKDYKPVTCGKFNCLQEANARGMLPR